eukprot:9093794-Lingulodinium_polyedra.AAC.1
MRLCGNAAARACCAEALPSRGAPGSAACGGCMSWSACSAAPAVEGGPGGPSAAPPSCQPAGCA